jgi:hypothetical protein
MVLGSLCMMVSTWANSVPDRVSPLSSATASEFPAEDKFNLTPAAKTQIIAAPRPSTGPMDNEATATPNTVR